MTNIRTLSTLPGEIQNQIVANLDPFSVIALRYTSQHFKHTVSLPLSGEKQEHLHRIECSTTHPMSEKFACYSCYRIKPKHSFTAAHTKGTRGKNGGIWSDRRYLSCLVEQGALTPGSVIKTNDGSEYQIYCWACATIQREWCITCKWCQRCVAQGWVKVWRKGQLADHKGNARQITFTSTCKKHQWDKSAALESTLPGIEDDTTSLLSALSLGDVSKVGRSSLSFGQSMAVYEYKARMEEVDSPEWCADWYDGLDDT